jgi:hypothetical protein
VLPPFYRTTRPAPVGLVESGHFAVLSASSIKRK